MDTLLAPDIEQFHSKLPIIVPYLARILSSTVHDLRSLANAGDRAALSNTSAESSRSQIQARSRAKAARQTPLSSQLNERVQALRHIQLSELATARTKMAATAAEVLAMRAVILERTVTLLERTKHGALARATKAKAEHLNTVAHGVEGKLRYGLQLRIIICQTNLTNKGDEIGYFVYYPHARSQCCSFTLP